MTGSSASTPIRATQPDDFAAAVDGYRRDVVLLCYRFLGSLSDAEEAAQETALRAWRARATFRGDATLRTWLHRIATRVCLDLLRQRRARVLPISIGAAGDPDRPPDPPSTEIAWLEPIPDEFLLGSTHDPAARYDLRESVALAFIAALQVLPPRQRAVVLLRDVLGWTAREAADALDMSVPAANSALHRARTSLRETHHRTGREAVNTTGPSDPMSRRLLEAYVAAWQADDVDGLVAVMRRDVKLAMPPSTTWHAGRADVATALRRWIFGALRPPTGYWIKSTSANGQPAALFGDRAEPDRPLGIQVLDIEGGRIVGITVFLDEGIASRF